MNGIFIPDEILKLKEIGSTEKMVLALYKYYTENGTNRCCSLSSVQIAEMFNVSSRYIKMVRKNLNDLGYIKTNGGIKVTYIGVQRGSTVPPKGEVQFPPQGEEQFPPKGTTVPPRVNHSSPQKGSILPPKREEQFPPQGEEQFPPKGTTVPPRVNHSSPQKGSILPPKREEQFPHKKEKKEKKEIKKEEKREMTNYDRLIRALPKEYQTPERIDFIKENYQDRINSLDYCDTSILDTWVVGIKNELNQKFPMEYKIEKPKPVDNTMDVF